MLDHANAFPLLQISNALAKRFHFRPMHFRAEMVLGVVTVVKKEPVINFSVATHSPRDRFVGICPVMAEISVQVTKAVAEVEKWQEKKHVTPVDEMDGPGRDDNCHAQQYHNEHRQLDVAPAQLDFAAFDQLALNHGWIVPEKTKKNVGPRILGFAVVAMFVNRNPVDCLATLIRSIRVALVVLHVDDIVVSLRKAAGDGFDYAENAIEELRTEKRVVNEIVRNAVDIGVDHERINKTHSEHDPERRVRE